MPWRSLDHLDLQTLRQVKARGNAPAMSGFPARRGWAVPTRIWPHVLTRLIALGYVQTGCGCRFPCLIRLTATGYAAINEPLPPRSWGVWEGKRQWP